MQRPGHSLGILLLASLWAACPPSSAFAADDPAEALKKCDVLASHPHDPGRYAPGVTDEQFAPGAAIEACEPAVKLNPDLARAWFELGRSYWIGQRDKDAFSAFVQAAKRNYAPAMKFIGDAYLLGRGLPSGQQQDGQAALDWYKKSKDAGFIDGTAAVAEAETYIKKKADEAEQARLKAVKEAFDSSIFQNSKFMSEIYDNSFEDIEDFQFISYVNGFIEELAEKVIFLPDGQKCTTLITGGASTAVKAKYTALIPNIKIGYIDLKAYMTESVQENQSIEKFMSQINLNHDRGTRDAVGLFNRYGCESSVALRVTENINAAFDTTWTKASRTPPPVPAPFPSSPPPIAVLRMPQNFHCENPYLGVDYVICASPQLMDALARLEDVYKAARVAKGDDVKREQVAWSKRYGPDCGLPPHSRPAAGKIKSARACVQDAMEKRILELQAQL